MSVERINRIEQCGKLWTLICQIRSGSATQHTHVNFVTPLRRITHSDSFAELWLDRRGIASCKHCDQLHILSGLNCLLNGLAKVAIPVNCYANW